MLRWILALLQEEVFASAGSWDALGTVLRTGIAAAKGASEAGEIGWNPGGCGRVLQAEHGSSGRLVKAGPRLLVPHQEERA